MPRLQFLALAVLFVWVASGYGAAYAAEQTESPINLPARFTAVAYSQVGATQTFGLTIYVNQLSTDGEIEELGATLKHKGPDALVSAMEDMKEKGRVAPAASNGAAMEVVSVRPAKGGGQHIVLVGSRPITVGEVRLGSRSRNYAFSIVVLNVDKNGKGTGSLAPACMLKFKKGELQVEHYGQNPFRLEGVRLEK